MAIVSGRRAVRPDGGLYRNMRRQRLSRSAGGPRRGVARLIGAVLLLAIAGGGAYAIWRFLLRH